MTTEREFMACALARLECAQDKPGLSEMIAVLDAVERREASSRTRAGVASPHLYRTSVVLEAAMRLLVLLDECEPAKRELRKAVKEERAAA